MSRTTRRCAVVMTALLWAGAAQADKTRFTPYDVARINSVLDAEISPDGKRVLYRLRKQRIPLSDPDGGAWTALHVVDAAGNSRPYVTSESVQSAARWTPDGQHITFLTRREADSGTALYAIALSGGEARPVRSHAGGLREYALSPDGKQVAFLVGEKGEDDAGSYASKGFNQEIFEEEDGTTTLWVAPFADSEAKAEQILVQGTPSTLTWSPDGKHLAVAVAPTSRIDDHYMSREVQIFDVKSGKRTAAITGRGKLGQVAWSPDGKLLALITGVDINDPHEGRILVAPVSGGAGTLLLADWAGQVGAVAWQDDDTIAFLGDQGVQTVVGRIDADGDSLKILSGPGLPLSNLSLARDGKTFAAIGESPTHPAEVFYGTLGREPKRLTDSNPWLADKRFAPQEVVTVTARDGQTFEGILIRPLDEVKGQRYPLVMHVHGGPESHIRNGWLTWYSYLGQLGAGQGFAVFYPNYRGSTGKGVAFSQMGQRDAAGKEFDDLVDAVDHLVQTGLVDTARVGISGGSYGGYASAWGATYYSERFAASVMFVGISDKISKSGTTDIPNEEFLVHARERPWDNWKKFLERSPIYHVQKAKTPILIMHGKEDTRVHPAQSMELYRHLKVLNQTPVRLVYYPGEGHGNARAASRLDYNLRLLRWMEHYLMRKGDAVPPAPRKGIDYEKVWKSEDPNWDQK